LLKATLKGENVRVLIACPLKKSRVYLEVCVRKCDWFQREKCPIQEEVNLRKEKAND